MDIAVAYCRSRQAYSSGGCTGMAVFAYGGTGFPFNAIPGREWTHPKSGYYTDENGRASLAIPECGWNAIGSTVSARVPQVRFGIATWLLDQFELGLRMKKIPAA